MRLGGCQFQAVNIGFKARRSKNHAGRPRKVTTQGLPIPIVGECTARLADNSTPLTIVKTATCLAFLVLLQCYYCFENF
jgi:hypothetical protein